jgi:hypothetical protein
LVTIGYKGSGFAAKACAVHTGIHAFFQTAPRAASACCLIYFLATAQESKQRKPHTTNVFNRTKKLGLWAPTALSLQICPSNFRSNDIPRGVRLSFAPKISLFVLKLYMRKKQWRGHQSQ